MILFGIAYQRGLFTRSLDDIMNQELSEAFLEKNPEVDQQAVFVAANQAGCLDGTKPMLADALNAKLQQLCKGVGLMERNTYYSLRRTAIIEVRRNHGTEAAKDLAFHVASADSLFFYDNAGFGDVDMQQLRLGGPEGMSRAEVQKYFSQANLARWHAMPEQKLTFTELLNQRVKSQLPLQWEYGVSELALRKLYEDAPRPAGHWSDTRHREHPNGILSVRLRPIPDSLVYQGTFVKSETTIQSHTTPTSQEYQRRNPQIAQSGRGTERKAGQTKKFSQGNSYEAQHVGNTQVTKSGQSAEEMSFEDEGDEDNDEDNNGVDEEVLEDQDINSREEPECWANGQSSGTTRQTRRKFLTMWLELDDSVVAQSNLVCPRCQIDPTMDKAAKEKKFILHRLNVHMRSSVHSREEQLKRAVKQDGEDIVVCPVCNLPRNGVREFMTHIKKFHPEQLWEDDSGSEDVADGTDFESFSDHVENDEEQGLEDLVAETGFERLSSPLPVYTGKGKARAE
ncbi:hypothetical protein K504DRAFT_453891 [Pleomassaria siparia CBS 279.74]|uniref:Uncharacterized protein n=1 Tax=Pleomassaria siparia CBS 279.74 TaxID=1314801 RepID=A0A6G1KDE1_9PLEO|nr:hypothetical protein K504DRAFT_453891 [Pleomassaria siparia CBS 279.74]